MTRNPIARGDLRWRASDLARATPGQRLGGDEAGGDGYALRGTPADCEAEPRFHPADETTLPEAPSLREDPPRSPASRDANQCGRGVSAPRLTPDRQPTPAALPLDVER